MLTRGQNIRGSLLKPVFRVSGRGSTFIRVKCGRISGFSRGISWRNEFLFAASSSDCSANALTMLLEEKHRAGISVLDLTESNPTRAGIVYPEGFLSALSDPRGILYEPEPFGLLSARKLIGAPENVAMTASTSEAYSWLFKLLCNPGDEVLVPRPSYPLFEYLAALESVVVRSLWAVLRSRRVVHRLPFTGERSLNEKTRAVVVVNPNNPTGNFIAQHELRRSTANSARSAVSRLFPMKFFGIT